MYTFPFVACLVNPTTRNYRHFKINLNLEKRSCQLFYYCVHMAEKTTSLCYVSFYVRCSVFHLGYVSLYVRCSVLDLPTRAVHVHGRHCVHVHAVRGSVFGCACARNFLLWNCFLYDHMSCFGYFVSWPGLFRFGAAETSFRGILLNDR